MCFLPRQNRSIVAAGFAFVLTTFAQDAVHAGEDAGHSPFGALARVGFPAVSRPMTAEHEALFAWPHEGMTDVWSAAELSDEPPDVVVFAVPVLPANQEVVSAPAIMAPSPPPIGTQMAAEHAALLAWPREAMTDAWSAAELSGEPPDDVVFALPSLPASQEVVVAPAIMAPSPSPIEMQMAAEHEALFAWPREAMTDAWSAVEQPDEPPDDVVFAVPALPASQEVVVAPAIMAPSPPLIETRYDAVVFGPPSAVANSAPMPDRPASTPSFTTGARSVPAPQAEETTRMKARARELLADGSVASARALLENAASGGDAESEYLLAQTYDPQALTRSGVIGVAGDAGKAEAFYRAAQVKGYPRPDDDASAAQP